MEERKLFRGSIPMLEIRALHIDLKGCVPEFRRLLRQLEIYAAAHYNAVLIEWEDMFPWSDTSLRSGCAYTQDEVRKIGEKCEELGLELIPLVQSLGHMENVLSQEQYRNLQEVAGDSGCIDPLNPGSAPLICSMVDDILKLLPSVHLFHLGGDEAMTFGEGRGGAEFIEKYGRAELYLQHICKLTSHLKARKIRPLLWADMMAKWNDEDLKRIAGEADLVACGYQGKVSRSRPSACRERLKKYLDCGIRLWGGCAYKGADGFNSELPVLEKRIENTMDWVETAEAIPMRGIIATGWSRYSTTRPQCEIQEGALQSAILTGAMLYNGNLLDGDAELVLDFLDEIGEGELSRKVTSLLQTLSGIIQEHWLLFQQHIATTASHRTQRIQGRDWYQNFFIESLESCRQRLSALRPEFQETMHELLTPECAEAYFRERELLLEYNYDYCEKVIS